MDRVGEVNGEEESALPVTGGEAEEQDTVPSHDCIL